MGESGLCRGNLIRKRRIGLSGWWRIGYAGRTKNFAIRTSYGKPHQLFRVRTRPPTSDMIAFIDKYRDRFTVEFICATLNRQRQGGFIASRGYRNAQYFVSTLKGNGPILVRLLFLPDLTDPLRIYRRVLQIVPEPRTVSPS